MKKMTTFLFFFFLIAIGVILMLLFTKKVDFTKFMEKSTVEEEKDKKKKKEKKNKESELSKKGKQEQAISKKEADKKEGKKIEKKEEKKEDTKKVEEKKKEKKEENILEKKSRKGKYWVMLDYTVTEKADFFEVKGSVYDADLYAEWVDEVGSDGVEEGETIKAKDGFKGNNLSFQIPKSLKVRADRIEWMEIKEKSVKEFLNGGFGSFLFENERDKITEMLDWYMNYSG